MKVNGEHIDCPDMPVLDFLRAQGYVPGQVVVERNLEIILREDFAREWLREEDEVNILRFMGGGSL
ncbi:MAG: sulfur carrier protein ThiS [Oscillospiraceae bacterium]|jgi:thiamine biosynthesis protein ThiS|nr:sulfur carrier protein ThiS [Oscillospiraceae bacterium]